MRRNPDYTIDKILRAAPYGPAVGSRIMQERANRAAQVEQAQIDAAKFSKWQSVLTALLALLAAAGWLFPHPTLF
jgi:hypothetical protein